MSKRAKLWQILIAIVVVVFLLFSFSVVGCKKTTAAETTAVATTAVETTAAETTVAETTAAETTAAVKLEFGYVSKLLSHPWFTAESAGIEKFAKEHGIEYIALDANMDDEKMVSLVDQLITKKVDALMVVVTSMGMGPVITKMVKKAGIPVISIDDPIKDEQGNPVPHVGMDTKGTGIAGGEALAALANERGFFKEGNIVKVLNGDAKKLLAATGPRTEGFNEGLTKNTSLVYPKDFIFVETQDGMMNNALPAFSAVVSANPKVTHWIATGLNDDVAVAALRTFEELGISKSNYLSGGIGGYDLALEELSKGNDSFISVGLRADMHGYKAAETLYNFLTKGTKLEDVTYISGTVLTVDNYKESIFWKEK
ncbi:MAG: substrate-binding domain-containing protein [Candidatus Humimicrobiaceae bacterium]